MPQELEVWYVLPKIRAELAKSMVRDCGLAQNKAAGFLQITKAAVSQYLSDKRANNKGQREVIFDEKLKEQIRFSAKKIIDNPELLLQEIMMICNLFKNQGLLCGLHRQDDELREDCNVCLK